MTDTTTFTGGIREVRHVNDARDRQQQELAKHVRRRGRTLQEGQTQSVFGWQDKLAAQQVKVRTLQLLLRIEIAALERLMERGHD